MTDAETMNLADACARLSGCDLQERVHSARAFLQMMRLPEVKGDEWRMVMELNPALVMYVSRQLRETPGSLRNRALCGQLYRRDIEGALKNWAAPILSDAKALPKSYQEAALEIDDAADAFRAAAMPRHPRGKRSERQVLRDELNELLKGDD